MTKKEKKKLHFLYNYIENKIQEKDYKILRLLFYGCNDYILLHREISNVILLNNIKRQFKKEFESLYINGELK